MKKTEERETLLINALRSRSLLSVAEATEYLRVSEATVRRLFAQLESNGIAIRYHGGIRIPQPVDNYSFEHYREVYDKEKKRIGYLAAHQVEDGDSIYLDCGTTILRMAEALRQRVLTGEVSGLNIVTNSIVNLDVLAGLKSCRILLVGGEYNHERRDFSGPISEKTMALFHYKKCFLGCEGWTPNAGFSSNHLGVSSMNTLAISCSDKKYILMDSSKFGVSGLVSYTNAQSVNSIITDRLPVGDLLEALNNSGMDVLLASGEIPSL